MRQLLFFFFFTFSNFAFAEGDLFVLLTMDQIHHAKGFNWQLSPQAQNEGWQLGLLPSTDSSLETIPGSSPLKVTLRQEYAYSSELHIVDQFTTSVTYDYKTEEGNLNVSKWIYINSNGILWGENDSKNPNFTCTSDSGNIFKPSVKTCTCPTVASDPQKCIWKL